MTTLKTLRETQNMSQADVAWDMHVDRSTLAKWESGRNRPPLEAVIPLATLYHVSVERLIEVIVGVGF